LDRTKKWSAAVGRTPRNVTFAGSEMGERRKMSF